MRRTLSALVLAGTVVAGSGAAAQASAVATTPRAGVAATSAHPWRCSWSPTMDDNWHNDALCSNGVRQVRPYLRPDDSYITRDELMSSARAWARARNDGR